jgi:hypothetical protein
VVNANQKSNNKKGDYVMLKLLFFTVACGCMVVSGCSSAVRVANYKELDCDLKQCEIKPPEYIINKKKPRVAVLPIGDNTEFDGKLSLPAQETLTQVISQGTGLEVVERGQLTKLMQEYNFGSNMGALEGLDLTNLAKNLDFIILGSVTSASVGAEFTEARSWVDKKGNRQTSAPSCNFSAEAVVNIRSVSASTGTVTKVFPSFKGKVSNSSEVRSVSQCQVANPIQLATKAVIKAIDRSKEDLQDAFPNNGYIYKTMTDPQNPRSRIAYVTLGKSDGVNSGDKVVLAKYVKEVDRIKGTDVLKTIDVGLAVVSETDLKDDSCIVLISEEHSDQVVPGYVVKTKSNASFFRSINKAF